LFLGEGNFSFSASVVGRSEEQLDNVYVSCYEKEEVDVIGEDKKTYDDDTHSLGCDNLKQKMLNKKAKLKSEQNNPLKNENISYLKSRGCHVLQEVDAEKLHHDERLADISFSRIIFMFPHVGGKMKIDRNRQLLYNVLKSSRKKLDRSRGQVIITLCKGQGGTPFESVERLPADTWKIVETGHEAGYVLNQVHHFPHHLFQHYSQVGYRGMQKGFNVEDSIVHILEPSESKGVLPIDDIHIENLKVIDNEEEEASLPISLYPPRYIHHLSFWIPNEFNESLLSKIITASVGEFVLSWSTLDRFTSASGRKSQTIEVEYCDLKRPLGHTRVMYLHCKVLGLSLVNCAGVQLRC